MESGYALWCCIVMTGVHMTRVGVRDLNAPEAVNAERDVSIERGRTEIWIVKTPRTLAPAPRCACQSPSPHV